MEVEDRRNDGILQKVKQSAMVQKLKGIKNIRIIAVVFIIADIILKELTASVIWLICGGKYLL